MISGISTVAVELNPFVGAHYDVFIWTIEVFVLDNVYILDAETFTGTNGSAGVMGLKNVLENNCKGEGSEIKYSLHLEPKIFTNEFGKVVDEILIQIRFRMFWHEIIGKDLVLNVSLYSSERISC